MFLLEMFSCALALPWFLLCYVLVNASSQAALKMSEGPPLAHKVLVIDDDDIAREAMCELLRRGGVNVIDLPTPIGVSSCIVQNDVTLVVLDVNMPTLSGDKLARLLRGNPRFKKLGIVLVSGCSPLELTTLAEDVKANAVVPKELLRRDLLSTVIRLTREIDQA